MELDRGCALAYLPIVILAQQAQGGTQALLTLVASAAGLLGMLNILWRLEDRPVVQKLARLGSVTIFIFLLHRYPITVCNLIAGKLGITIDPWLGIVVAAISVLLSILIGRHIIRRYLPWLEQPIWKVTYRARSQGN